MLDESAKVLEQLKAIRSELEGTNVDFEKTQVSEQVLQKLRQLVLMHTPYSITEDVRKQFEQHFKELLSGQSSQQPRFAEGVTKK